MSSILAPCPLCAESQTRATREQIKDLGINYIMWYCHGCGSEFAMPRQAASSEYYEYEVPAHRWEFDEVAEYLAETGVRAAVLDIGCSDGGFVGLLMNKGIEAEGIDFNHAKIIRAQAKGLNCQRIDLRDMPSETRFAAITAFHVLEHLEDPENFLLGLKYRLRNDGLLFLSMPNPARYQVHYAIDDGDRPPHHLQRISKAGMRALAEHTGFEILWNRLELEDTGWVKAMSMTANRILDTLGIRAHVKANQLLNPPVKAVAYLVSLPWVAFWQLLPVHREGYTALYCLRKEG